MMPNKARPVAIRQGTAARRDDAKEKKKEEGAGDENKEEEGEGEAEEEEEDEDEMKFNIPYLNARDIEPGK